MVALSGGFARAEACAELAKNRGMIASFSRALLADLRHGMSDDEFDASLGGAIDDITYCTQRISSARIEAEKDGRRIRDGEIVTACQAVCPADAIVFGDLNDPGSQVVKLKSDPRNYILLNELNTQPRTTYLASLKNQNKEMPDYKPPQAHIGEHETSEQKTGESSH